MPYEEAKCGPLFVEGLLDEGEAVDAARWMALRSVSSVLLPGQRLDGVG